MMPSTRAMQASMAPNSLTVIPPRTPAPPRFPRHYIGFRPARPDHEGRFPPSSLIVHNLDRVLLPGGIAGVIDGHSAALGLGLVHGLVGMLEEQRGRASCRQTTAR